MSMPAFKPEDAPMTDRRSLMRELRRTVEEGAPRR